MIEITNGTIEERIIKLLQKIYPITISDIQKELQVSRQIIIRVLQKFQTKGIIQMEPLPDKTFIRLSRNDFMFVGKKRQKKFIKHHKGKKKKEPSDYEGIMFS
jgi:DNA-binding MarR family transcriptional regulator